MKRVVHKVWFFVMPLLACMLYGYYVVHKKPYISPVSYIIKDGNLTKPMQDLLKLSYVQYDGSLQDCMNATQHHWIRPHDVKRWEMDDTSFANRREIWDAFEKLHIVQRIEPMHEDYLFFKKTQHTFMVVTGGSYDVMKAKMQYIKNLHDKSVNCCVLIFLGTDRKLDLVHEIESMKQDFCFSTDALPQTELEMIKYMSEKMIPKSITYYGDREYICVQNSHDSLCANMDACNALQAWLKSSSYVNSAKADMLIISSQPYIAYEHSLFTSYMPQDYTIQTVGPATIEFMHPGVYFDMLARLVYQENFRMNMSS